MSKISVEIFEPLVHRNHMPEVASPTCVRHVLVVSSGKFRLEFQSQAQLEAAIRYFLSSSGSTRLAVHGGDHWDFQPWQSRLPAGVNNRHKRDQLLSALLSARKLASEHLPP